MKIKVYNLIFLILFGGISISCKKQEAAPTNQVKNASGSASVTLVNHPRADDLDFMNHAKQGDARRVKSIIQSGKAGIYSADENGETALMVAANLKNREIADLILDKIENSDKNVLDRGDNAGKTAMIYAAESGVADIIKDLRKKNADPNVYDNNKDTPLYVAVKNNQPEAVAALLENIADTTPVNPNLRNNMGVTPVLAATINKNNALLKTLKDAGADFNIPDSAGATPLAYAASKNDKELFDYLLSLGADVNYLIDGQKTVLTYAIENKNNDFIRYILDKGGNPNLHANVLPSPLQILVSQEKVDPALIDYMITKGAKLTGPDIQGGNVISWAIHKGNAPAIKKLIENGAKVSELETATNSGVLMAANIGDPEIAEVMIANGSDATKPNDEGFSPLALAAKNNFQDLFLELIKRGADVNAVSRNKYATPLEIVFATNNSDLLKMMFDNGLKVSPDAILLRAISEKKHDLITVALAYGGRPNIMNSTGQPALWLATAKDDNKAVQDLVDNAAILDVQDNEKGLSPLSLSILRGNVELAKYLIDKGANPNLADKSGYTALTYAAVTGQEELIPLLLQHKASPHVTDISGNTIPALVDLSKMRKEKKDAVKKLLAGQPA